MKITEQSTTRFVLTKDTRLIALGCLVLCLGWMAIAVLGGAEALGLDPDPLPSVWASLGIGVLLLLAAAACWVTKTVVVLDTDADLVQMKRWICGRRKVVSFPFSHLRDVVLDDVDLPTVEGAGSTRKWARCLFLPRQDSGYQRFELVAPVRAASRFRAVRDWAYRIKGIPLER